MSDARVLLSRKRTELEDLLTRDRRAQTDNAINKV
jgi:hypothetical protein